jgi:lysophospholipase L1-like esterase
MKTLWLFGLLVAPLVTLAEESGESFRPLFNGRDLAGWVPVNTAPSTWTVEDGMLVCSGKPIGELRTERMYQNFVLEVEWRHLVPKGNAGIFVWADDITARGVPFHRGVEVQVLENAYGNTRNHSTHGDIFPIHGARMTPVNGRGGSRAFPTEERSKPSPEWNHYRVTCKDGEISLAVNGKVVTRGTDCRPRRGYICLESEGGVVHYRNLRIRELPSSGLPGETAIPNRGYRSLYSGLDLTGWRPTEGQGNWQARDWVLAYDGPADSPGRSLESTASFGDFGFVFDVRRKEDSSTLSVYLRGAEEATFEITADQPAVAAHRVSAGQWNRFEGVLRGDRLTLLVNDHVVFSDHRVRGLPQSGAVRFKPHGPVDLANIYVRSPAAPAVASRPTAITLGDSITKGVRRGVAATETFAAQLEVALRKHLPGATVVNVGIGGERTDHALERLETLIARQPQLVTIMYGTNDSYIDEDKTESRISTKAYRVNLLQIVLALRLHGSRAVLMTEPRWSDDASPNGIGEHPNAQLAKYVDVCRDLARELDVPLVDHFAHWGVARANGQNLREWTTDGCHPNPRGHDEITETVLPVLRRALDQTR